MTIAPAAILATFSQRIRCRLPIAPYNPARAPAAPATLVTFAPPYGVKVTSEGPVSPSAAAIVIRRTMSTATAVRSSEYELVLMLDPEIPEEQRDRIASDTRQRIESSGDLKHDTAWGMRKLAYEIRQRTEADYRFFRFETGGGLLDDLNHNLRIADGVLRFRIFKVDPRSPAIVPPAPVATGAPARGPRRQPAASEREAPTQAAEAPAQEDVERSAEAPGEAPTDAAGEAPAEQTPPAGEESAETPAEEASAAGDESAREPGEEAPTAGDEAAEAPAPESESEARE